MQSLRKLDTLLVTGGLGFIGSAFIQYLFEEENFQGKIINLDLCTYAALSTDPFLSNRKYRFVKGDIRDQKLIESLLQEEVDAIVHFAAETHVDRSIASAKPFFETNVMGTLFLLEALRKFPHIHFHHISTDEVYGSLKKEGVFHEKSLYQPNSPYSASKAASDHLVRSFSHTYGLSVTLSHCSNNYGPRQYPEKLIPLMIHRCLQRRELPIYGNGSNVRDWLYVTDHAKAIWKILRFGKRGETYDIGGGIELSNLKMVHLLIDLLGQKTKEKYHSLITFVEDRKGHDFRYAIDSSKIQKELGWKASVSLKEGLEKTLDYYLSYHGSKPI